MKNVCDPNVCHGDGVVPLLNGGRWLHEMGGQDVLEDLIPDVWQLVCA